MAGNVNASKRRRLGLVASVAVAGILAAGCGTTTAAKAAGSTSTITWATTTTSPPPTTAPAPVPTPVGTPQFFTMQSGIPITVTLTQVVDPATPGPYTTPPAGDRYVGLVFEVADTGTTSAAVDMDSITALVDSSGQSYSATFDTLANCTDAGLAQIAPSTRVTTCVGFAVPMAAKLDEAVVGSAGKTPGYWSLQP